MHLNNIVAVQLSRAQDAFPCMLDGHFAFRGAF